MESCSQFFPHFDIVEDSGVEGVLFEDVAALCGGSRGLGFRDGWASWWPELWFLLPGFGCALKWLSFSGGEGAPFLQIYISLLFEFFYAFRRAFELFLLFCQLLLHFELQQFYFLTRLGTPVLHCSSCFSS